MKSVEHLLAGVLSLSLMLLAGCSVTTRKSELNRDTERRGSMKKELFGRMADGTEVDIYTLTGVGGVEARITNYGGIIVSLKTPDRDGRWNPDPDA